MISRRVGQSGRSATFALPRLPRLTPELGMGYLQRTHPVCELLDAPHFVRGLERGGDVLRALVAIFSL
jgi:hypothetical protein